MSHLNPADFAGTPMPVKTPINFAQRKKELTESNKAAKCKLLTACLVTSVFIVLQMIGGIMANSIAIFTDTAHLASDLVGFSISVFSLVIATRPASKTLSFGYHRAEIIGTLVSIITIQGLTLWLFYEATLRIIYPPTVKGDIMLITAVMGLFFNLIQMKILHSGDGHYHLGGDDHHDHSHGHSHNHGPNDHAHKHGSELKQGLINDDHDEEEHDHAHDDHEHNHETRNINIESAMVHILGDIIMSIGVIVAATFIYFQPTWTVADPICTYFFSVIVVFTTVPITKNCILVLMEGTPKSIDQEALLNDICNIEGVEEVHDFHVWAMSVGKFSLTVHVKSDQPMKTLNQVTDLVRRKYNIYHTTIQMEGFTQTQHNFACENDLHE